MHFEFYYIFLQSYLLIINVYSVKLYNYLFDGGPIKQLLAEKNRCSCLYAAEIVKIFWLPFTIFC